MLIKDLINEEFKKGMWIKNPINRIIFEIIEVRLNDGDGSFVLKSNSSGNISIPFIAR